MIKTYKSFCIVVLLLCITSCAPAQMSSSYGKQMAFGNCYKTASEAHYQWLKDKIQTSEPLFVNDNIGEVYELFSNISQEAMQKFGRDCSLTDSLFVQMQAKYREHGYHKQAAAYDKDLSYKVRSKKGNAEKKKKRLALLKEYAEVVNDNAMKPDDLHLLLRRARLLDQLGDNEKALTFYNKVLERKPKDKKILAESYYGKAMVLLFIPEEKNQVGIPEVSEKQIDDHIKYLKKTIQINPYYVQAYRNLGFAQYYFKSDKKAYLGFYTKALKLTKRDKNIKDKEQKIKQYTKMIEKIEKELGIKT